MSTEQQRPLPAIKAAVVAPRSQERLAWDHFLSKGYSSAQTAGILGNLRQEHNFKTDDVMPHGLGIAQWLGGRRLRLLAKAAPHDYQTQLDFIIEELQTTEKTAERGLRAANTVEEATIAFQNLYERCGNCKQSQRIQFAKTFFSDFQ